MLYPATMEVDFTAIPLNQCAPALDGLFVTYKGAEELVRGMRRTEHDCAVRAIDDAKKIGIAEALYAGAKDELRQIEALRTWALVGKIGVFGGAAAAAIAAIVAAATALFNAFKHIEATQ